MYNQETGAPVGSPEEPRIMGRVFQTLEKPHPTPWKPRLPKP